MECILRKLGVFFIASLLLTGCTWIPVYHPDAQQGNIFTSHDAARLKVGMSQEQVLYVLGAPVLKQNFVLNRWDYVYTFKTRRKPMEEKRLTLYFKENRLVKIDGIDRT